MGKRVGQIECEILRGLFLETVTREEAEGLLRSGARAFAPRPTGRIERQLWALWQELGPALLAKYRDAEAVPWIVEYCRREHRLGF